MGLSHLYDLTGPVKGQGIALASQDRNKLVCRAQFVQPGLKMPSATEHYRPEEGRTSRVVLAEIFTGSSFPPRTAADVAFAPLRASVIDQKQTPEFADAGIGDQSFRVFPL